MKLTGSGNTGNRVQGIMKYSKVEACKLDCCTTTTTSAKAGSYQAAWLARPAADWVYNLTWSNYSLNYIN